MKSVHLKFEDEYVIVKRDANYEPDPPFFTDRESIVNALNLVRDTFIIYDGFLYQSYESQISSNSVIYKVGSFYSLSIGNNIHAFYNKEYPYELPEVDTSFGLTILDEAIEKILS